MTNKPWSIMFVDQKRVSSHPTPHELPINAEFIARCNDYLPTEKPLQPALLVTPCSNLEHVHRNTCKILTRKAASFAVPPTNFLPKIMTPPSILPTPQVIINGWSHRRSLLLFHLGCNLGVGCTLPDG